MRSLFAVLILAVSAFGQSVQQDFQQIGTSGNYALKFYWTAASNGSVPVTLAQLPPTVQGLRILQVETIPLSPAPTNGYAIALTDASGGDLMTGAMATLSSSNIQFWSATAGTPPIVGTFSLKVTGQSVASAKGQTIVYIGPATLVSTTVGTQGPAGPAGPTGPQGTAGGGTNPVLYQFSQTPGGTLSSGISATVTLTPCPGGVSGSDTGHYLYISGGTGTAEAVLIVGGTCTSGATTGTVVFTPANNHSGAWTIASASGGIEEAINASSGFVQMPPGTFTLAAQLVVPSNTKLMGAGPTSIIQLIANGWPSSTSGPFYNANAGTPVAIVTANNASNVVFEDFVLDMNGSSQANTQFGTALALMNNAASTVQRVQVLSMKANGQAIGALGTSGGNIRILNSTVTGLGGGIAACAGGIFIQTPKTYVAFNSTSNLCDEAYIANGPGALDVLFEGNLHVGNASATVAGFHAEDSSRTAFIGNTCRGLVSACFNVAASGVGGSSMSKMIIAENIVAPDGANTPAIGIQISGDANGHTETGATVVGNIIQGGTTAGIVAAPNASKVSISKNIVTGANVGILLQSGNDSSSVVDNVLYSNTSNMSITGATNALIGANITDDANNQKMRLFVGAYSNLPTCNGTTEGMMAEIGDSNTVTWGATIAGGSVNHVMAYCDGTQWTVGAK